MEFRVLGPFEVVAGGHLLELAGFRQRLLLARLAVAANRVVTVPSLLDELWGGVPPSGGKEALQALVSRARRSLGDPARLVSQPPGYLLRLGSGELDSACFAELAGGASALVERGDLRSARTVLAQAEGLWRGPALAEFADYAFAQGEAARLEELRLVAIEEGIQLDLALGRHGVLAGQLEGLVDAHPFRERLWGHWMLALYRAGRQAEALRAYSRLQRRLGEELGIEPGAEVAQLEEAILLHKPELDWAAPELGLGLRTPGSTPRAVGRTLPLSGRLRSLRMVGRQREAAVLLDAWAAATGGSPSVVVVTGEAGLGKTRIVDEITEAAADAGAVLLVGGCAEMGGTQVPYAPLAEALRRHLRSIDPATAAELVAASGGALPLIVPELPGGEDVPALSDTARLHGLLLGVLGRLCAGAPMMLVLEDLHWGDPSTLTAIEFLARNLNDENLLIVVTVRGDELHPKHPTRRLLTALERCPTVRRLDLRPLRNSDVADLVAAIIEGEPDVALLQRVIERADGNPLFVEELVAGHQSGDQLRPTLRELLIARVETLGERAAGCARLLALAGRPLSHHLLAEASHLPPAQLLTALRHAVDHHVVVAEAESYRFRHALVGEALDQHLLPGERTALHCDLATALSDHPHETSPAELAHHWHAAGRTGDALQEYVKAAEAARRALANTEALSAYEHALTLWDEVPDAAARTGMDRSTLVEDAAELAFICWKIRFATGSRGARRAIDLANAALGLIDESREPSRAGLLHARLALYLYAAGRDGQDHADAAHRLIPSQPASPEHAWAVANHARGLMTFGHVHQAVPVAREAVDLAVTIGDELIESNARNTLGTAVGSLGDMAAAEAELKASLQLSQRVDRLDGVMRYHLNLSGIQYLNGRADEALKTTEKSRNAARQLGVDDEYSAWHQARTAACLHVLGRWDECEEVLDDLDRKWPQVFDRLWERAAIAGARGDASTIDNVLRQATPLSDDPREMEPIYWAQADLALWAGDPLEARRIVATALNQIRFEFDPNFATQMFLLGIRAEADYAQHLRSCGASHQGDDPEAKAAMHLASLKPHAQPTSTIWVSANIATAEAELARLKGSTDPAPWRQAVVKWEEVGHAYPLAYARWRAAAAILRTDGSRDEVAALLHDSRATAERLRLAPLLKQIENLLADDHIAVDHPHLLRPGPLDRPGGR